MLVDHLGLLQKLLVLLVADIFPLDFLPALNLVHRGDDAAEFFLFEVGLLKRAAALAQRALQASLQGVEQVT